MTFNLEKLYFKQGTKSYKWPKPSWCCCLHLFTTCSTSSLSTSSIIWGDSNPSGVKGGVEGEGGINKFSVTGPLLAAPPLVSAGAQKYFLLLKFRRTRLLKMISQGLSSSASNNFKVSMLTWKRWKQFCIMNYIMSCKEDSCLSKEEQGWLVSQPAQPWYCTVARFHVFCSQITTSGMNSTT